MNINDLAGISEPLKKLIEVIGQGLVVKATEAGKIAHLTVWKFTPIGTELLSLIQRSEERNYIQHIADYYKARKAEVYLVEITNIRDDGAIESKILEQL